MLCSSRRIALRQRLWLWRYSWLYLRWQSPRKLANALKIWASYAVARLTGRPVLWGLPVSIGIEPTTACNLRCPQCISGTRSFTRPTGRLRLPLFQRLVAEVAPTTAQLVLYFQGEPYLNPDFLPMVAHAASRGIFTASSTNAHFLTPETARQTVEARLCHLVVSLDGLTQETYAQYRREGTLDTVLQGLRHLMEARRQLRSPYPFVTLQFIAFSHNEHEIPQLKQLARELAVDRLAIKTAQVYDFGGDGASLIPSQEQLRRYTRQADGSWAIKNRLLNHCWKLWSGCEISWDGRVLPCCFDKDAQYVMGTLAPDGGPAFADIWHGSPAYRHFRSFILKGRRHIPICQNCTEGTRVWSSPGG